jgi:hypothetical protein
MPNTTPISRSQFAQSSLKLRLLAILLASALTACGGGGTPTATNENTGGDVATANDDSEVVATATTTLELTPEELPEDIVLTKQVATPFFHVAPMLLDAPDNSDAVDNTRSARRRAHRQTIPDDLRDLQTRGLTLDKILAHRAARAARRNSQAAISAQTMQFAAAGGITPFAANSGATTYTPAQIRAAYGLPTLPSPEASLSASQAALLGAGQTIYIVDAHHNPNAAAELAQFNTRFGLPACTTKAIAVNAVLPLPQASTSACEFSVVYNTPTGAMTATPPPYDSGWATEIALDVQWSHAIAPLARIVLIESASASLNDLLGGVKLANAMGPGAVSMSFGTKEGSWTSSVDSTFTAPNMTYLAATGDYGMEVNWPSVSPNVLAVGGTTLTYSNTGTRSEISWSGTGGGISTYVTKPGYQGSNIPGLSIATKRVAADVAFNADPASGQYVAVIPQNGSTPNWISAGGTSISSPQWAGIVSIANAVRALSSKPPLGFAHPVLYGQIGAIPGTYANSFADIKAGSHGSCGTCLATTGFDELSGLGTPNFSNLLTALTGATQVAKVPVVTSANVSGQVGVAFSFTASATGDNPLTYSLSEAPTNMKINAATGGVTWAAPVIGTYAVTVTATDSVTKISGKGTYTVTISNQVPPTVIGGNIAGKFGQALSFNVNVSAANGASFKLNNAPTGMIISSAGVVTWAAPAVGTYAVTVVATDIKTKLTGQAVYNITIAAVAAPAVTSASVSGKAAQALTYTVGVTASNPVLYTLTGAPTGMTINTAGIITWISPVVGSFKVTVNAKDSKTQLMGQGTITFNIGTVGPVITASEMTGIAGKAMTGTIKITDPGVAYVSVSISGVPMGMTFTASGLTITANWTKPVKGKYTMTINVVDSLGLRAKLDIPITVN